VEIFRLKGVGSPCKAIDNQQYLLKEKREQRFALNIKMSKTNAPINEVKKMMWECKQCHSIIDSHETVAYHLVDRVLYGWCEPCFNTRPDISTQVA
jgi:hypothetical protein